MNLTGLIFKNNRITILSLFIILILGLVEYQNLSRDSMPPFTVRTASIVTQFPGATPERVEALVTDKIEKALQEIPEVETIESTNRTGLSIIKIKLLGHVDENEIQDIWDLSRRKIENIQNDLPRGIYGPNLNDEDIGEVYGIFVAIQADNFDYSEIQKQADKLRNRLIALDDAAKVVIGGETEERVFIDYEDATLTKLGVSASKIERTISQSNIIIPSGEITMGKEQITVETSGSFESVEALKNLLVPVRNNELVSLGEIATVKRAYQSPRKTMVRVNGEESLALYISLKENSNIINLGKDIDRVLVEFNKELPLGLHALRIASQDIDVQQKTSTFVVNLVQSVVIVLLVVLLVLGWRAGIVIASIIPCTIIMAFWIMSLFNVGLNQVTLASLIMALGLLVDNGIVMTESLIEKLEEGQTKFEAAVNSCKEFMVPLLISSLTTCAAFMSFYLAQSVMGEIMGNIFKVITITLLTSWFIAFTIIPLLGSVLLKVKKRESEHKTIFDNLRGYYNTFLNKTLAKPIRVLVGITILFVFAIYGFTKVPGIFMPPSDRQLVTLELELPLGTKIEETDAQIAKIETYIKDSLFVKNNAKLGVESWSSYIGRGPKSYDLGYSQDQPNSSYAYMLINTNSGDANQIVINKLDKFAKDNLLNANVKIKRLTGAGASDVPIEVRVFGDDPEELFLISDQIKKKLTQTKGTKNVSDNWGPKIKKVFIDVDEGKLGRAGLTNQDVALSLNTALSGYSVGEYRENEDNIPIVLQNNNKDTITYDMLETLGVYSQITGQSVPLTQVADISLEWVFAKILRRDLKRSINIESQISENVVSSEIIKELEPWLKEQSKTWKPGYTFELGGDAESGNDAMGAVAEKLPLSFIIIILLLVLQFNSFRKVIIILSTIPLAAIGVSSGLLVTDSFFSFTAFLGIISLAGIIINDAIVLIDKMDSELASGKPFEEGIKKAANDRFSPILLTTLTTSCGMIPLWTGGGELWSPMAISVIFGLLFATIILLIFIPVVYKVLFKKKYAA
ncbi:efflux RND transporter permease subunit [Flavivirga sp. 57AJ16]|uniref:efflux RND transporter permease subunit n=1 Tax=Flavivirga sp. 57AJ16 TaxID=3025307 RepID=UPI0023673296|nr:efflux RND transporter permease subunit [Flavivirga sp. 57AJ16]MDD7886928.1 efflux RND transporter permease subunit [Flavivirga sp. 57AJ16]